MWRRWKNSDWRRKKQNEVSTSDEELDSDYENEDDGDHGPTLVTIDDGKGGIKHIKVDKVSENT